MNNFKTTELDYKSIKLHVETYEHSRNAPAIIVVHGTGAYSRYYAKFCRDLSDKGYNVITFDFMGHGRSGGDRGIFTMTELLENISTIISHAIDEYSGKIGLVGTSQGGEVAFYTALKDNRVKSLVCHNIFLSLKFPINFKVRFLQSKLCDILCAILPDFSLPTKVIFKWKRKGNKKPALIKRKKTDSLTVRHYSFKSYRSIFTYKPGKPVDELSIPTLIAVGERDELIPKEHCQKVYNILKNPKEFYVMPNASHQLLIDYPDLFVPKVDDWFKKTL
ncbi:MAG: alpha/beta hydrolase [Candidatus Anammoxibacter sp.]